MPSCSRPSRTSLWWRCAPSLTAAARASLLDERPGREKAQQGRTRERPRDRRAWARDHDHEYAADPAAHSPADGDDPKTSGDFDTTRDALARTVSGPIMRAGGTAPHAAPARARPRPCVHLLPVACVLYGKHHRLRPAINGHEELSRAYRARALFLSKM